jgi:hypothetical protein
MIYNTRKDLLFKIVFIITILICLGAILPALLNDSIKRYSLLLVVGINALSIVFLTLIYFKTYYTLNNQFLRYQSGPFFGKVKIDKITRVDFGKTQWVGLRRYGLAQKGLIIYFNNYDDLYISPEHPEKFIEQMLSYNDKIIVNYKN